MFEEKASFIRKPKALRFYAKQKRLGNPTRYPYELNGKWLVRFVRTDLPKAA